MKETQIHLTACFCLYDGIKRLGISYQSQAGVRGCKYVIQKCKLPLLCTTTKRLQKKKLLLCNTLNWICVGAVMWHVAGVYNLSAGSYHSSGHITPALCVFRGHPHEIRGHL